MAKEYKSPYDTRTKEARARLFPFTSWITNKVYKTPEGVYVFMNQKGYIHVLKPRKVSFDGQFSHYTIVDLLLTVQGAAKETSEYGYFKTREDCISRIENVFVK